MATLKQKNEQLSAIFKLFIKSSAKLSLACLSHVIIRHIENLPHFLQTPFADAPMPLFPRSRLQ